MSNPGTGLSALEAAARKTRSVPTPKKPKPEERAADPTPIGEPEQEQVEKASEEAQQEHNLPPEGKDSGGVVVDLQKAAKGAESKTVAVQSTPVASVMLPPPAPRLPNLANMLPTASTIDPVMLLAFTRVFETTLMSLRSTWDKLCAKQSELDKAVDQARAIGFPEDSLQALAAQYRWEIGPPA